MDRERNTAEQRVLRVLIDAGDRPITRSYLAERLGLSSTAITNVVRDLDPILEKSGPMPSRALGPGPRAEAFRLDSRVGVVFGADFQEHVVKVAVSTIHPREVTVREEFLAVAEEPDKALDWAAEEFRELLQDRSEDEVVGVGVSIAAPVDSAADRLVAFKAMAGWHTLDVVAELEHRVGWSRPIHLANNANLGALAEHRRGAGRGVEDLLYVHWGQGIGAGLIVQRALYEGRGLAGEIGHTPAPPPHDAVEPCEICDRICLEALASGRRLALSVSNGGPLAFRDVVQLAAGGNGLVNGTEQQRVARERLYEAAGHVGRALGGLATAFNPQRIVLGGEISRRSYPFIAAPLRRGMSDSGILPALAHTSVVASEHAHYASVRGAIELVLQFELEDYLLRQV